MVMRFIQLLGTMRMKREKIGGQMQFFTWSLLFVFPKKVCSEDRDVSGSRFGRMKKNRRRTGGAHLVLQLLVVRVVLPVHAVVAVLQRVRDDVHLCPQRLCSLCYDSCDLLDLGELHLKPLVHVIVLWKRQAHAQVYIQWGTTTACVRLEASVMHLSSSTLSLTCFARIKVRTLACQALMVPCLFRRARSGRQGPEYQLEAVELALMRWSSICPLSMPKGTEQPAPKVVRFQRPNIMPCYLIVTCFIHFKMCLCI